MKGLVDQTNFGLMSTLNLQKELEVDLSRNYFLETAGGRGSCGVTEIFLRAKGQGGIVVITVLPSVNDSAVIWVSEFN